MSQEALTGDPVALARALIATPSVNPELEATGTGEATIAELTAEWMKAWGLAVETSEVAPGRWNVVQDPDYTRGRLPDRQDVPPKPGCECQRSEPCEPPGVWERRRLRPGRKHG